MKNDVRGSAPPPRPSALVGAGEIVVEKDVPAEHEVSRVVHVLGKWEPAMSNARIADPTLGSRTFRRRELPCCASNCVNSVRCCKSQKAVARRFPCGNARPGQAGTEPGAAVE